MAVCAACGAENRAGARFCDSCGAPLAAAPKQHEQRKTVTVLFCDVVGSTALGESTDPEALRALLARYFERMRTIVEAHGGTVEKFIGDAVMAVFGVPVVHEDDAVRAVRAAAEMRDALPELGVQARIGVNTGEVVTGTEERLATGDAVNVAARLQQAAGAGEILLGAETRSLARDAIMVEELPRLELKGKHEPVAAFRLTAVERHAPGVARHLDAPMVGRADERKLLDNAFANAVRRRACALFTLLGTAGVGKSRLTREFLAGVDALAVVGRCLSYGEGITYWPVVEILKQLGAEGGADPIGVVLGESELPTTPEEIAWAVRKLLEASAQDRPLVVVFDDVHWGEPTFLDLVEHVADLSRDAPILLLCLARPELLDRRPGWGGGKLNATTVLLEPLDAAETGELIERLLGGEVLEPGLAERIRVAAEGNPLYVEEMLAMVRESGERDVVVPPTIKALLAARLDQLDPAERAVLERGAVEGQLFHSAAVAALASPPAPAERQLVSLVRKELVRPDRAQLPAGDAYRFRHLLIRDAAYDALPKAVRAELHQKFAAWLEERADDLVERDEIVGYHLEQAYRYRAELGEADEALAARAAALLAASGRTARVRGDLRAAAGLVTRAAALHPRGRLELLPDLGDLLFDTGEVAQATAVLDEAIATAHDQGDEGIEAVAKAWRALVATHAGEKDARSERVIALADEAAAVLERLGDDASRARVIAIGARNRFYVGQAQRALDELQRAQALALEVGALQVARDCMLWTLGAMAYGPTPVEELARFPATLPSDLRPSFERLPWRYVVEVFHSGFSGRLAEAREFFALARAMAEELGLRVLEGAMTMFLGEIELDYGNALEAEGWLRGGYEKLGELGESGFRSTVGTMLAAALVDLGRDDEAWEVLSVVDKLAIADDVDPQVRLRSVRARILARRGELPDAVELARDAVEIAARTDYVRLHGNALLALAEVLDIEGSRDEVLSALGNALVLFERKGNAPRAESTRARLRELEQGAPPLTAAAP
jgi:class 3 adenylate cyclase/tetratricopeptide (TPR) repeat protein